MIKNTTILIFLLLLTITACGSPAEIPKVAATAAIKEIIPEPTQPTQPVRLTRPPQPTEIMQPTIPLLPNQSPQPANIGAPTATLFPEEVLHTVIDENGAIEVNLPVAWSDMRTEPWVNKKNQVIGTTFIVATNVDDFLHLKAEGVAISVSNRLGMGYIQLLDEEAKIYKSICEDTYKTTWTMEHPVYRGKYVVLGCSSRPDSWLDVYSLVNKNEPGTYIARVIALDMVPTYGDTFRDIILQFKVFPENLP